MICTVSFFLHLCFLLAVFIIIVKKIYLNKKLKIGSILLTTVHMRTCQLNNIIIIVPMIQKGAAGLVINKGLQT
jgi:hypothetical protein